MGGTNATSSHGDSRHDPSPYTTQTSAAAGEISGTNLDLILSELCALTEAKRVCKAKKIIPAAQDNSSNAHYRLRITRNVSQSFVGSS